LQLEQETANGERDKDCGNENIGRSVLGKQ
jgi:hypothetical protein